MGKTSGMKKVGIGWYSENEWLKLCSIASDADRLEKSYEEWLGVFQKGCNELLKAGLTPVKVPVHVQDLLVWCTSRGLAVDSRARSEYIAELLRNRPEESSPEENRNSVKEALFETVEKQIRENSPRETRQTLERLVRAGCSRNEAMKMIAGVLVHEMKEVLRTGRPFNRNRYIHSLKTLKRMPA